jgi:multidrug transporter EmrE-like cation transporter
MNRQVFALIVVSVFLSSAAQMLLKAGMSSLQVSNGLASNSAVQSVVSVARNPWVLVGLTVYFLSALVWLLVLARVEVSIAYPFVGMGFVVTMVLAWLIHAEPITTTKLVGTLIIAAGVMVLTRA